MAQKKQHKYSTKKRTSISRPSRDTDPDLTFAGMLKPLIPAPAKPLASATRQSAPLSHLAYKTELQLKNQSLALFWEKHRLPEQPESVIASPRPRNYRTTSKRKVILRSKTAHLLFGEKSSLSTDHPFLASPLEPEEHAAIYEFLQKKLSEPSFHLAAKHLNYLIIRGSYHIDSTKPFSFRDGFFRPCSGVDIICFFTF